MFLGDKMSNKTCNSCGKKVDIDAYECPHCSSHVFIVNNEIIYPEFKICNSCGKKVNMLADECPHCSSHVFIVNNEIIYPDSNSFVSQDNGLHCPQCSSIIPEGDNFCKNCGYQIQSEKNHEKPNFCPKCGAEIEGKYKFCIKCGEPI